MALKEKVDRPQDGVVDVLVKVTGRPRASATSSTPRDPSNKYVGETERQVHLVFQRAREKAGEGTPVIVFFDEMESLFRTRGSDVENTIVPQLLAEIDGVEGLENVTLELRPNGQNTRSGRSSTPATNRTRTG